MTLDERLAVVEAAELEVAHSLDMRPEDTANYVYAETVANARKRIAELEAALRALLKGCERYDNNPDSAVAGAAYDAGMDAARKALGT